MARKVRRLRRNPETDADIFAIRTDILLEREDALAACNHTRAERLRTDAATLFSQLSADRQAAVLAQEKLDAKFVFAIERFAEVLELPDWDTVEEFNRDQNAWQVAKQGMQDLGIDEEEDPAAYEEKLLDLESAFMDEVYVEYRNAVLAVATRCFERVRLEPKVFRAYIDTSDKRGKDVPYEWELVFAEASTNWRDVAHDLWDEDRGYGDFEDIVDEVNGNDALTWRGWVADHIDVVRVVRVNGKSPRQLYDQEFR